MGIIIKLSSATGSSSAILTTPVAGDYTLKSTDKLVEADATSGNIIITLPAITFAFKNKGEIIIIRTDNSMNTVTINGTAGNYGDEGFELGNDPELQSMAIYASNANIWRALWV